MKTRKVFHERLSTRLLRVESLESRELLDAATSANPVSDSSLVLSQNALDDQDVQPVVIPALDVGASVNGAANLDINNNENSGEYVYTEPELFFTPAENVNHYTMSWDAVEGADTYIVQISHNAGETWIKYASGVTDTSQLVKGLYIGKSYSFRVYGVDSDGVRMTESYQGTFAPISIQTRSSEYVADAPVAITIRGADNAAADIRWYAVTDDGDVEYVDARGATSFTPQDAQYQLKVVAIGVGDSAGSQSEAVFEPIGVRLVSYDPNTRYATLEWSPVADAATYVVQITKNGGASWAKYAQNVAETSLVVQGLYVGKTYSFRVYGVKASGTRISTPLVVNVAPFTISASAEEYSAGDTLSVSFRGADNAQAEYRWYLVNDLGEETEIEDARGLDSYAPSDANGDIRVVATGVGDSAGVVSSLLFTAPRIDSNAPSVTLALDSYDPQTRVGTLSWTPFQNAETYVVQLSRDGGETWLKYASNLDSTNVSVKGLYVGKSYMFRVFGVDENGDRVDDTCQTTVAPISIAVDCDFCRFGDLVTVNVAGAENAQAVIRWYEVTPEGDVEITDAAGLQQYAVGAISHDLKVVAEGLGDSEGCNLSLTIPYQPLTLVIDAYDVDEGTLSLSWTEIAGAAAYELYVAADNGAWTLVAQTNSNSALVAGVLAGSSSLFRVYGVDANGAQLAAFAELDVRTLEIAVDVERFEDAGTTVTASVLTELTPAQAAGVSYQWYRVVDGEATPIQGADSPSYTTTEDDLFAELSVVVSGSNGVCGEAVAVIRSVERPSTYVTTSEDVLDPYDGRVSLREAIEYGKYLAALSDDDEPIVVTFDEALAYETMTFTDESADNPYALYSRYSGYAEYGTFWIDSSITIDAQGLDFEIDAESTRQIFYVNGQDIDAVFNGLVLINGFAGDFGGAISFDVEGGSLTVENCFFMGNSGYCFGGAISVLNNDEAAIDVTIRNSVFCYNSTGTDVSASAANNALLAENASLLDLDDDDFFSGGPGGGTGSGWPGTNNGDDNGDEEDPDVDPNAILAPVVSPLASVEADDESTASSGGLFAYGGAVLICIYEGSVDIDSCEFYENDSLNYSGALYVLLTGENPTCSVRDSYFEANTAAYGGAVAVQSTYGGALEVPDLDGEYSFVFDNVTFYDNYAPVGGAMIAKETNILFDGCCFDYNYGASGGALYVADSNVRVAGDSLFKSNEGVYGGAVESYFSNLTLDSVSFLANAASYYGGAIWTYAGSLNVENSSFAKNSGLYGGAIRVDLSDLVVENSTFAGASNPATPVATYGGAIFVMSVNSCDIVDSTFTGFKSRSYGGAFYAATANIRMEDVDVVNCAGKYGGGLFAATTDLTLTGSSLFYGNTGTYGAGLYLNSSSVNVEEYAVITNCSASTSGGGAYVYGGSFNVAEDAALVGNLSAYGGGIIATGHAAIRIEGAMEQNRATSVGGAFYLDVSTLTVDGGIVENNAAANGGACYLNSSAMYAERALFYANSASESGGAIYGIQSSVSADATIFEAGAADDAAVIAANGDASYTRLQSVLVVDNEGDGDALKLAGLSELLNVTVADNEGGVAIDGAALICNSILWGNGAANLTIADGANVTINCVLTQAGTVVNAAGYSGLWLSSLAEAPFLAGSYALNPQWYDPALGISPIGTGANAFVDADYDLNGQDRVSGSAVDLGALESQQGSDALVDEAFADLFIDGEF